MAATHIDPWNDNCPVYQLFNILGQKRVLYILYCLKQDISSFNAIMKRLPKINSKVLSEKLDLLIEKGLVLRIVSTNKPLKIHYELTPRGDSLVNEMKVLENWAFAKDA